MRLFIGVICVWVSGFLIGIGYEDAQIKSTIKGYHCTKITTHTSLESAQEQVRVYQAMVRG